MKRPNLFIIIIFFYSNIFVAKNAQGQSCPITVGHQYPTGAFSAASVGTWYTVSTEMNGGNWTLFNVTPCNTYTWTYCSDDGGSENFDAELTLYNYTGGSTGSVEGYSNNSEITNCPNAPLITWTCPADVTEVQLLTTQSGCLANTGPSYNSTLVWQEESAGQAPSAPTSVSASSQRYCAGGGGSVTLQLTGPSLPGGASWVWYENSCGGTQVGTGVNVFNIVPTQTTTYYARAESACGNSACLSTTVTVVQQPPSSIPTASPNPVCSGNSFTLAANATGSPYEWYYNTNTYLGNSQSLTENSSSYGSGSYCYTYTANECQSAQGCVTVTVSPPPAISFSPGGELYLCSSGTNSSLALQVLPNTLSSYVWSPGTGLSSTTVSNPTVSNLTSTTYYTVIGTDNNGCTGANSVTVNVTQTPTNISITPASTSICTGGTGATLSVNGTAQFYSWSPSNGLNSTTSQSVTANPSSSQTYTVTVSNGSNISCTASASSTVSVNNQPSVSILPANPVIGCGSNSVTLSLSTTGTYSWSNGSTSPTITVSIPGPYSVTVTNPGGCTGSASATANVSQTTGPTVTITPDLTSGNGTLNSNVSGGTQPYTYSWSPGTDLSSTTVGNPSVTGLNSTITYTLKVTDDDGCSSSATITVSASTQPCNATVNISAIDCDLVVTNIQNATYQWFLQGDTINGATSRFYTATGHGYYTCNVNVGSCIYTSNDTFLTCYGVGIESIQGVQNLSISPNPSSGSFSLSFDANQGMEVQIKIYDLIGNLIQAEEPVKVAGSYTKQINLPNVAKGVYILQIKSGDGILNRKIEVE